MTNYSLKGLEVLQGFCLFHTIPVWGNQSYPYKTGSNAIQHGISYWVALQCLIKGHTFQGNHVLYCGGMVANHLQSGSISRVGHRVCWVLDWVWEVRSFVHISQHFPRAAPLHTNKSRLQTAAIRTRKETHFHATCFPINHFYVTFLECASL